MIVDDTTLAADSGEKLQEIVKKVNVQSKNAGLHMKCERYQTDEDDQILGREDIRILVHVDGQVLEQVRDPKISCSKEIKRRIAVACSNFREKKRCPSHLET